MAFYSFITKSYKFNNPGFLLNLRRFCKSSDHEIDKSISIEVDALDDFTTQLVQRKTDKWDIEKAKALYPINSNNNVVKYNIDAPDLSKLNESGIDLLFKTAVDSNDENELFSLIKQCLKCKKTPSLSFLLHVLSLCSLKGDKETIIEIGELCKNVHPEYLKENSNFEHYLAEAFWIKGNITKSLELFEKVYKNNTFLRRRIRLMMKCLVSHVVNNSSEGVLLTIIKFSEMLVHEYRDYFPLVCIWQACFLSEWFTDQCIALELMRKNYGLCKSVINKIPYVVNVSLRSHRTEIVYRLLELLIEYEMKPQYTGVILALFDYQIRNGDLRGCSEIIKWSLKYQVELPNIHHEKFINLFLRHDNEVSKERQDTLIKKPPVSYKF